MPATSFPIRQEVNDNRRRIRSETDFFLESVEFNTSDYAPLKYVYSSDILLEAGGVNAARLEDPDPAITGALQGALPMYIAISTKRNIKIQFMMLVNPSNMTHGKTSTVPSVYTRKGFITQMWGPNQDLITATGKTAAFMVDGSGLTNVARRRSFSYANFLAFLYSYRNNGYLMLDPTKFGEYLTRVINIVHGVEITYDNQVFTGHFNNFTLDEAADRPFLFDYNFEFVCSTLDGNYNEIRGHFLPLDMPLGVPEKPVLLEEIGETNEVDTSVINTVEFVRLNKAPNNTVIAKDGKVLPITFEGDLFVGEGQRTDAEIAELGRQLALFENQ